MNDGWQPNGYLLSLKEIESLEKQNEKMRNALAFYAGDNELNINGKIRKARSEDRFEFIFERARQALEEITSWKQELGKCKSQLNKWNDGIYTMISENIQLKQQLQTSEVENIKMRHDLKKQIKRAIYFIEVLVEELDEIEDEDTISFLEELKKSIL